MRISGVCILGGTGFVGSAIAERLSASGMRVRIVTRSAPRAAKVTVLPTVEVLVASLYDDASLARCFENMDAAINLVGILHPSGRHGFEEVHARLPARVATACRNAGVRHLLHMSALGASAEAPSEYLRSKGRGEAALRAAAGPMPVTIFRPSVIFGPGDRFVNLFAKLQRFFPIVPLAGAGARFQPVWVEDVARCFAAALGDRRHFGQAYDLAGPHAYTLAQIVGIVGRATGHERRVLALPGALARVQAFALEHLPGKLMTRDNLRSMSVDNTTSAPFPPLFGFAPSPMEAIIPEYLAGSAARARYPGFRHDAGR